MGVDTRLYVPMGTRVGDVADVMGILAGLTPTRGIGVDVKGAGVRATNTPTLAEIWLEHPVAFKDGNTAHYCYYHFEVSCLWNNKPNRKGYRLMLPPATPFWTPICVEVARFFGGVVDLDDSDGVDVDYNFVAPQWNSPTNGKAWHTFYDKMMALKPL